MDYKNGRIYKLTDVNYTKCYIGSTTQPLCKRFYHHKAGFKSWKNGIGRKSTSYDIFEEFGVENCFIELIESFPCSSKEELIKREGYFIKNTTCVNKIIMGRTPDQYRVDCKEKIKEYRDANKDKMKEYRDANKDKMKEYRQDNKDKIKLQKKIYNDSNKEKIKLYKKKYRDSIKEKNKLNE
jgi:hypothetical protein